MNLYTYNFTQLRATANSSGLDFIVGDWHRNPVPESAGIEVVNGSGFHRVEWEGRQDSLSEGQSRVFLWNTVDDDNDIAEGYDLWLDQGVIYACTLSVSGSAPSGIALFTPQGGSPFYAARAQAAVDDTVASGIAAFEFTPQAAGYHGVIVYAENPGSGSYRVSVWRQATDVREPSVEPGTRMPVLRVHPNPASDRVRLTGATRVRLVSSSGREVADLRQGENDIRRLSPGVYLVRSGSNVRDAAGARKLVVQR